MTRLAALRSRGSHLGTETPDPRLQSFIGFGSNPGELIARSYVPAGLQAGAPLVVVLHGCTQSASSYNRGAGWTSAADEHGFALLFPEQQRGNNPNLCFNWFSAADTGRGRGEALSIAQMVQHLCRLHDLDRSRIYITGLSAGGAMAAAMLATYPELFAGGAVIAGLPFGTATTVPEAFERMRGPAGLAPEQLTRLVRSATPHSGTWPTLSVWHGSSDRTVDPSNAAALVDQWRGLHDVGKAPTATEMVEGQLRRVWCNAERAEVIEEYTIADMGHGTPIHPSLANQGEAAGPHMLNVGISSTRRLVGFWSLKGTRKPVQSASHRPSPALEVIGPQLAAPRDPSAMRQPGRTNKVAEVIETALKNAGLMR